MVKGQAFLALVFLIGSIIILVGVTLAIIINTSVDTSYGYQAAIQAQAVATAGVEDALLQLDRNPSFPTGSYSFSVASSTANVSITQGSGATAGKITILSSATVNGRTRKLSVVAAQDATTTGDINIISWQTTQ